MQAPSFLASTMDELQKIDWRGALYGCYLLNDLTLEALQAAREIYRGLDLTLEHMNVWQRRLEEVRSPSEAVDYLSMLLEQFWQWRNESTDKYAELLLQVKHYIMKHYHNDRLSLQEAADYVNVSPSHLSKVFSQETGQTFIEFLTHTRIRKAMELLQTTHAKSYEIAHQIGYNDAHYFSNLFKRITGMTTTRFRKEAELTGSHKAIEGAGYEQSNWKVK
ncbi:HTH-type transcriptional activator Btr [compost metagenome]